MMPKIKFEIKKEISEDINKLSAHLQMYDERFPETSQCGGYDTFKELCLQVDDFPEAQLFTQKQFVSLDGELAEIPLLRRLHPLARQQALELINYIRKKHKIGESWRNIKKENM